MPDTPPTELTLDDLIDQQLLQNMLDAASEAWGLRFTVFRPDGTPWERKGATRWFCAEMRTNHPEHTQKCQESDRKLIRRLVAGEPWVMGRCWLGLWDIAAPIAPEGRGVIGALLVGGFRDTGTTAEQVLGQLGISGAEADELRPVFADTVKGLGAPQRDSLRDFVVGLARLVQQLVEARDRAVATAETLRRAQGDAQGVLELSTHVGRQTKVSDVLREVVEGARAAMRADRGGLSFYVEHSDVLRIEEYLPREVWERSGRGEFSTDPELSLEGRVFATQETLVVRDVQNLPEAMSAQPMGPEVRGIVLTPLSVGEKHLGVLWVDSDQEGIFSDADGERLRLFAAYSAIAVQNARTLKERDDFMELMTHQIVAPLNAIRQRAIRLEPKLEGEAKREASRLASHAGLTLNVALKFANVFRLLRGEAPHLLLHCESLLPLVTEEVALYSPLAEDREITIAVERGSLASLPSVPMDRDLIRHVLANLLDNAIKYSVSGSRIQVNPHMTADGLVCVSVTNLGLPILDEDRERVFEFGYRTPQAKAAMPTGTGIGLAVAATILRLHGGRITVRSERQGQAYQNTFDVELPSPGPLAAD